MNIYEKIKADLLEARKAHNEPVKKALSSLLAEADRELISKQPEEKQIEIINQVLQKAEKSLQKALEQFSSNGKLSAEYQFELDVIATYLPKKLTVDEIRDILKNQFGDEVKQSDAMKFLSQHYKGLFNAKEVLVLFTNS